MRAAGAAAIGIAAATLLFSQSAPPAERADVQLLAGYSSTLIFTPDKPAGEIAFPVDAVEGIDISVLAGSKTIEVTLLEPGGATRIPDFVSAPEDRPGRSHEFSIAKPAVGTWRLQARETGPFGGPRAVILQVEFDSDLSAALVGLSEDPPAGRPASLALIVADRRGGLAPGSGISIQAWARMSGQPPLALAFHDDGLDNDSQANDGAWAASFTAPAPGVYDVVAQIAGTRDGAAFARTVAGQLRAVKPCGTLGRSFSSRGVDTDGDRLEDALELTFDVTASEAGRFDVDARLASAGGVTISVVDGADLPPGLGRVPIRVPASRLAPLGPGGPYRLARASLFCVQPDTSASYMSDRQADLGNTVAFNAGAAPRTDAIAPSGDNTDRGVDSDGNARFDVLEARIGLLLTSGGAYQWEGRLFDSQDKEIDAVTGSGDLAAGQAAALLRFSGRKIGANGLDGPYQVRFFHLRGPADSLSLDPASVTQSYRASQFEGGPTPPPAAAAAIEVSPSRLDFGSTAVGQTNTLSLAIRNAGNATLSVSRVSSDNAAFTVVSPGVPFALTAGASLSVTLRFAPTTTGLQQATLTIASNDPNRPGATVALTGAGAGDAADVRIEATPASLDFGAVQAGQTRDLPLTVRALGNAPLNIASLAVDNPRFTVVSPATPFTVGFGGSANVLVRFAPTAAGAQSGTLTIRSNAANQPSLTVALAGTGAAVTGTQEIELKVDDGTFERNVGYAAGAADVLFVNRLPALSYPVTLKRVRIYLPDIDDGVQLRSSVGVVAGLVASDTAELTSTSVRLVKTVLVTKLGAWLEVDVPEQTVPAGTELVVGYSASQATGQTPAALDTSGASQSRSFGSANSGRVEPISRFSGGLDGNLAIRAVVTQ
jgi:hypothetical protein